MSWFTRTLSSTIGRKLIMSLTGLFLIAFLLEHLIGNFLLLKADDGLAFNEYAHFMKESILVRIGEVVLFGGFLFHIVDGILLMKRNRQARKVGYTANKSKVYNWASRYMGPFGIILLVFLILHLNNFFRYKYFPGNKMGTVAESGIQDMAGLVYAAFSNPLEVVFYVLAMAIVAFHLWHGFESAFQTLGLNNKKYTPFIRAVGRAFAVIVPLGFALIPLIIFFR